MSEAKTAGGYIWRIKELEEENIELKAHVERLRSAALKMDKESEWHGDYLCLHFDKEGMDKALEEVPPQSLAAHDREVAEKVREACVKCVDAESAWAEFNSPLADASNETVDDAITSILNLDLDEVLKDE